MTTIFSKPSSGDIKLAIPPMSLRYNNKEKCFAFQSDGFIQNGDGQAILPDAVVIGYSDFYGHLRNSEVTTDGVKTSTPKEEDIRVVFWIPLPTAKNTHELLPIGSVVVTPLVTRAIDNFQVHVVQVQNSGKALYEVVTNFKPGKYDTKSYKAVDTLTFIRNELVEKDAKVKDYLTKVATWIHASETIEALHLAGSKFPEGNLIKMTGDKGTDIILKQQFHQILTGETSLRSLPMDDSGEDFTSIDVASVAV